MTTQGMVYATYGLAALGAVAVYWALPRGAGIRRAPSILLGVATAAGLLVLLAQRFGGSTGPQIAFGIFTIISLGAAVRVITHPKPVYSALYFVLVALSSVGIVVLAGAEFLGAALVIVYAGAILVTYVFVIMLAQQSTPADAREIGDILDYDRQAREPALAVTAGFMLMGAVAGMIVGRPWPATKAAGESAGNTEALGAMLLTRYAISVELAGVLLLVAIIGAIALARKPIPLEESAPGEEQMAIGEIGRHVKPF